MPIKTGPEHRPEPLLDILYREYPPLAPTEGKLRPREVPAWMLEQTAPLQQFLRSTLEGLPPSVTTWGVTTRRDHTTVLSLQWLRGVAPAPLLPPGIWAESGVGYAPSVAPPIGDRMVGVRYEVALKATLLTAGISVMYGRPQAGGSSIRRYEWNGDQWVFAETTHPYTDDIDAVAEDLWLAPTFDQAGVQHLPPGIDAAMKHADMVAPLHGSASVGIAAVGLSVEECILVLAKTDVGRPLASDLEARRQVLDHRRFDLALRHCCVDPMEAEEVSVWGVA